jgi:hypothetical protein
MTLLYGSGMSDGNRHDHGNLPILLSGGGNGWLKGGRHVLYPKNTPIANLYLTLLNRLGVPLETIGDSTGSIDNLLSL